MPCHSALIKYLLTRYSFFFLLFYFILFYFFFHRLPFCYIYVYIFFFSLTLSSKLCYCRDWLVILLSTLSLPTLLLFSCHHYHYFAVTIPSPPSLRHVFTVTKFPVTMSPYLPVNLSTVTTHYFTFNPCTYIHSYHHHHHLHYQCCCHHYATTISNVTKASSLKAHHHLSLLRHFPYISLLITQPGLESSSVTITTINTIITASLAFSQTCRTVFLLGKVSAWTK